MHNVFEFESIYQAHRRARLGKRHKRDVVAFEMDLANALWNLKNRIERKTYNVGKYKVFSIREPKEREIQALKYSHRVVMHSLCDNYLTPFFEKRLIYDNCACRVGKGTHFGLNRLEKFFREHYKKHGVEGWILKVDIKKYFASIDHEVLLTRLRKIIPDTDIMEMIEMIIGSWNADIGYGLPMGNQTSQLFAVFYLDPVDRLIKEKLRVKHYTRYMDDMVLIHHDKAFLKEALKQIRAMCADLKLELNEKTQMFPIKNGVDYLGWHVYLTKTGKVIRKLRTQNKKRLKRRMRGLQKGYEEGRLTMEEIRRSLASTNGHLRHGDTWNLWSGICAKMIYKKTDEPIKKKEKVFNKVTRSMMVTKIGSSSSTKDEITPQKFVFEGGSEFRENASKVATSQKNNANSVSATKKEEEVCCET